MQDPALWPSAARASALLLSLEALARWREHVALTSEDDLPEPQGTFERADPVDDPAWGVGTRSSQPGYPIG
jgi:hypothetical protein